ncbi:hypothetical protein SSP24_54220 [Streptomyces spinoverrucosus]|uniref:Uncharacterized protein n=1 Tax=Streptomyces spinoverrucosus TaxID=284043 RepID=A0A4Y3VLN4_9ACTN|nr:hypothetical protein SSP24_54220 [Streptomyces spinoverrucosus]GHB65961.1 hypothetical protein GCM10010397_39970 [Streptomyces spinoverrucosus]
MANDGVEDGPRRSAASEGAPDTEGSDIEGSDMDSAVGADKAVTPGQVRHSAANRPRQADGPPHHAVGDTRSQRASHRSRMYLMRW